MFLSSTFKFVVSIVVVVPLTVKLPLTVTSFAKVALLELSKIKLDVLSFLRNIEVIIGVHLFEGVLIQYCNMPLRNQD